MSERKGGRHTTARKTIHVDEETHQMLLEYCQGKRVSMKIALCFFIRMGVRLDLFDSDYTEKLREARGEK